MSSLGVGSKHTGEDLLCRLHVQIEQFCGKAPCVWLPGCELKQYVLEASAGRCVFKSRRKDLQRPSVQNARQRMTGGFEFSSVEVIDVYQILTVLCDAV